MSTFRQKVQATTNWVKPGPEDLDETPRAARRAAARARKRAGAPITTHRLFPAFAALWFAALFGLGSLAIPGSALGALVLKTGLPALVPAAAPPLGFTAHLLLAFLLAGFGAGLGLALALRLRPRGTAEARQAEPIVPAAEPEAEPVYKVRARDAHPDAPPRRPLVLTEALIDPLGEEAAPGFAVPLLRSRPAPAASEPAADVGPWIAEFTPGGASAVRPLDLAALELADVADPAASADPQIEPIAAEEAPVQLEPEPEPEPEAQPAAPVLIAATPQLPAGFVAALPDVSDGTWSPVAGAPLESLGLVQLIERLALAIAAQKASNAAVVEARVKTPEAVIPAAEPDFTPGPFSQPHLAGIAADAALAGDVPPAGSAREAILHRLGAIAAGDLSGEALNTASATPLFSRPAPVAAPQLAEAVVPLRPAQPGTAAFAPPAASVSSAAAAPLETDEALRSALATLQRMTARA
ncbi:hypothetical protein [Novosphingobium sp.]|uniref:hypothetical protein n=1 Tax=Novosphingobium sp. TaxID=1874826 RepID=UPI003BAA68D0